MVSQAVAKFLEVEKGIQRWMELVSGSLLQPRKLFVLQVCPAAQGIVQRPVCICVGQGDTRRAEHRRECKEHHGECGNRPAVDIITIMAIIPG